MADPSGGGGGGGGGTNAAEFNALPLEDQNRNLRDQIRTLRNQKKVTLQRVQQKLTQLIAEKNSMLAQVTERQERNAELVRLLEDPERSGQDATQMSVDQLRQRVAELEQDRATLQQKIKSRLSGLISEKHQKTQRIHELEQRQVNPAELQNLREKIHDLEDERGELTAKISSANDELQNVQSWLQENMHLREQLDKMMVESRMIQQQITDLQQKADRAVSEIHELSNQIAQLEEMNADYEKKIDELKAANRSASLAVTENARLRAEVVELSREKTRMTDELLARESDADHNEQVASKELTDLRQRLAESEVEVQLLQEELAAAQQERDAALEAADKLQTQRATLLAEKKGVQTQMLQMQRKAEIDKIENEQYERTLTEITTSRDTLLKHIAELEVEIRKGEEWDTQNQQLRADMSILRNENSQLELQLSQLEKGFEPTSASGTAIAGAAGDDGTGGVGGSGVGGGPSGDDLDLLGSLGDDA